MIIGWHFGVHFGEIFMLLLHRLPVPGLIHPGAQELQADALSFWRLYPRRRAL